MFSTCWDRLWMWINSSLVICEFSLWRNIWPFILWNEGFLGSQLVKNPPTMQETQFDSWARKFPWKRDRLPTPVFLGFPGGSDGKESACNAGDLGSIPGLGRSPGEGKGYPLQYSGLENSMDCIVHGVTKSRTRLSDFHSFHFRHRVRGPQIARAPNLLILIKIWQIKDPLIGQH